MFHDLLPFLTLSILFQLFFQHGTNSTLRLGGKSLKMNSQQFLDHYRGGGDCFHHAEPISSKISLQFETSYLFVSGFW